MKSVMIDIETLSTEKNAAVISIGLAAFDDSKVIQTAGWALNFRKLVPGHIDPGTIGWWMEQNEAVRDFSFTGKVDPYIAAQDIIQFMSLYGGDELWANDPTFDIVILQNWWKQLSVVHPNIGPWPSNYKHERSFRTIRAEAERLGHDLNSAYAMHLAHNPIDDAATQARVVILARKLIGGVGI